MTDIRVQVRPRPKGWADLPQLNEAQQAVLELAEHSSLVVRGAPGSGRTTCALALLRQATLRGEDAVLLVPDRLRADALTARAQSVAPTAVRPVRTPASYAYSVVSTWRLSRHDPLGPVELVTGASHDELIADLLEAVDAPWPDSIPEATRRIRAFRAEVRDLFARAGEVGFDGAKVIELGRRFHRDEWVAAGTVLDAYLSSENFSVEHRDKVRVDLSRIQSLAADLITHWDAEGPAKGVEQSFHAPNLVIVDDVQDCTPSTIRLLSALHNAGSKVVAFADPDVAIAEYRGGEPHLDLRLRSALDAQTLDLGDVYSQGPCLRECVQRMCGSISQSGSGARRKAQSAGASGADEVHAHLGGSNAQLGAHIAQALRRHRLHDDIAWSEQAVIARSSAQVAEFTRYLRRGGVPVAASAQAFDFASGATTRTLLQLCVPVAPDDSTDFARQLLYSPLIGVDSLELHRLLEALKVHFAASGAGDAAGGGSVDAEGVEIEDEAQTLASIHVRTILDNPHIWRGVASEELSAALEIAHRLWSEAASVRHLSPRQALWRLWDAANVAEPWRRCALEGGADSAWCDDQLDAVVALMRVADIWEQRNPAGTAADFAEGLLHSDVPLDTIAQVGVRPPGVAVLTPAQAVGGHWKVVAVVGLQDGVWPNMRLRTHTLRSDLLVDIGAGRIGDSVDEPFALDDTVKTARKEVQDGETRLLVAAISRCTQVLHIGAVSAEDDAPSIFFDQIAAAAGLTGDKAPRLIPAPAPLNLAGQIADLRRESVSDDAARADEAAALLALLAREGVSAADPDTWTGEGPLSTTDEIASGTVRLSPSQFESALTCPLKWFFTSIGADGPAGDAQTIGSLVHAIAEQAPHGTKEELLDILEEKISELAADTNTWEGQKLLDTARQRVSALAEYIEGVPGDVDVEVPVKVRLGDVDIAGRIDRIEKVDGGVRIVDLKTGTAVKTDAAKEHPQLALYQLALNQLGYEVVEGKLVYLKGKVTHRSQSAFDAEKRQEWIQKVAEVGELARGAEFCAHRDDDQCKFCSFKRICPSHEVGRKTLD